MPHVALVPFTGLRVCREALREVGFTLPGLRKRGAALAELPALGLLTLAGMMPEGWTCSYHPAGSVAEDELFENVLAERPTLVALSALSASIRDAYAMSERWRAAGAAVVIGGLHATACPSEAEQFCDAVVVGPGESVWQDVLDDAREGSLGPRYVSRPANGIEFRPVPRFDLLGAAVPRYTLQTQRGCPLACDFCAASRLLGPYREKPIEQLDRELAAIGQLTSRPLIELADDNTFAGKRDGAAVCNLLRGRGAVWFTESDWRIGERPELLEQMAASGCVQVLVGIESLTFRYPGMGAKQVPLGRILDAIGAIQDHGIAVNGCFILGADGETHRSIDELTSFILDSPFAEVQLTLQTPFPGTQLRRRLEREGRILAERDWPHYTLLDVTFQPDCLSVEELERAFLSSVSQVYSADATERRGQVRRQIWNRNPSLRHEKRLCH